MFNGGHFALLYRLLWSLLQSLLTWLVQQVSTRPNSATTHAFLRRPQACQPCFTHHRRKTNWLRHEVLRLKAHMRKHHTDVA